METNFDLRLLQYEAAEGRNRSDPKVIGRLLITFETLDKLARKERVFVWNLPLSALQRKIGENGRFCLPEDATVIDNVLEFSLFEYKEKSSSKIPQPQDDPSVLDVPSALDVYWIELRETPPTSPITAAVPQDANQGSSNGENRRSPNTRAPMKEKDWDYVFQANSILNCALVDSDTTSFKKAPFAAFRIRDSNEDDAELPLPQDDEKAKIPTWSLSIKPSRTHMIETNYELEKSAVESSNSKESLDIGLSGSFKGITPEVKYGRTKESSYKDSHSYGKKEHHMFLIHEVPVVEISLHKGNSRLSEGCRQALLKLRDQRQFSDLMDFFSNYGTIYAKRIILGGRLLASQEDIQEKTSNTVERELSFKQNASVSLGIKAISISGGYSSGQGYASSSGAKQEENQTLIDWRAYGGNAVYASKPDQWKESLNDYHYWEVIQNTEIESIQDFIGSFPGYDDIPGLFDSILRAGLYDPYALLLCQGNRPLPPPLTVSSKFHPLGAGVNSLSGNVEDIPPFPPELLSQSIATGTRTVKGGVSWQVLDSATAVQEEISSFLQTVTNTGTNYRCVPPYFYDMTMRPKTVTVILQWSTDTMSFGLINSIKTGQLAEHYNDLSQLYHDRCEELKVASSALTADIDKERDGWEVQAQKVQECINNLQSEMRNRGVSPGVPLYDWMLKQSGVWTAMHVDLLNYRDSAAWSPLPQTTKAVIQGNAVAMMEKQIQTIVSGNPGPDGILFANYNLTSDAKNLLNKQSPELGAQAFISKFGHSFVKSYTETGKLSAIWSLELDPFTNAGDVEIFRMVIQQYFLAARSVSEVCEFFAGGIRSRINPALQLHIKTSIFGFCNPASITPRNLHAIEPWRARYYLTTDALQRNRVRLSYRLHPFAGLQVNFGPDEKVQAHAFSLILSIAPDQHIVLSLQDILRQLFVLNGYAKVPAAKVDPEALADYWSKFNVLEGPQTMDPSGNIQPQAAMALDELSNNLQQAIQAAEATMLGRSTTGLLD